MDIFNTPIWTVTSVRIPNSGSQQKHGDANFREINFRISILDIESWEQPRISITGTVPRPADRQQQLVIIL